MVAIVVLWLCCATGSGSSSFVAVSATNGGYNIGLSMHADIEFTGVNN